ncbi:MAG: CinA family protein, partial [Candidatus Omnitrophica bacterium]|nr:CinA family protein [Candidatus Omnitrophota bacterium]
MKLLQKIIHILKERKLTISLAESCTGGYTSYLLTKIPGSSAVFKGSVVVYSMEAKKIFLGIPHSLLKNTPGVSKDVCIMLAKNIRNILSTDLGASIVGFAGPTSKKGVPVGTIFISIADKNSADVKKLIIKGDRDKIRKKASN